MSAVYSAEKGRFPASEVVRRTLSIYSSGHVMIGENVLKPPLEGRLKLSTIPRVQQPECGAGSGRLSGNKSLNNSEKRSCIPAL